MPSSPNVKHPTQQATSPKPKARSKDEEEQCPEESPGIYLTDARDDE
tara:strand:+ start:212 stop:352 length:141 start_codon:yes stop_codon:yes gene_type:complete